MYVRPAMFALVLASLSLAFGCNQQSQDPTQDGATKQVTVAVSGMT